MNVKTRVRPAEAAFLMLLAAVMMLFFSRCSPLYPSNFWVDSNCYMTVGRGMRAGLLPYRDLMEQKGPLLYFLHYIAALISENSFLGAYLLECLNFGAFLILAVKTARLFADRYTLVTTSALCLLGLCGAAFASGDLAEEFCLIPIMWAIYDGARYFLDPDRAMPAAVLIRNGALAGCVLWIKYTTLGVSFAFMAVIALECAICRRKIGRAIAMCGWFLLGMALSCAPWLAYFGINGAIGDLLEIYFVQNLTDYAVKNRGMIGNLASGLARDLTRNTWMVAPVTLGVLSGARMAWRKSRPAAVLILAMAACGLFFSYVGGRGGGYTFFAFIAFIPFAAARIAGLLPRLSAKRAAALCACLCVFCGGFGAYANRWKLKDVGGDYRASTQWKFAQEIQKTENPTLLNVGFLDGGFYLAADVIPTERWFCALNVNKDQCLRAQSEAIESGRVDYAVTCDHPLSDYKIDDSKYDLIMQEGQYYLYRLKSLGGTTEIDG